MRCNRLAIYGWKSKYSIKHKPKVLFSTLNLDSINPMVYKTWIISHTEPCNGEILSQIELDYIPYMGGTDANIEVIFKCRNCGYMFAGDYGLPYDVESLNKFLTEIIKEKEPKDG